MHHRPRNSPEIVSTPRHRLARAASKGDSPRRALHQAARRHGIAPERLRALIADQAARSECL
jgi:hypothetical protein